MITPERLYIVALGLSGAAAVVSVTLPPLERGHLVASIASATLGAALGSFSLDTFLLSRPAGWVAHRGRVWLVAISAVGVVLSAAIAVVLTAFIELGSYWVAAGAACALTTFNVSASLALRLKRFTFVYTARAVTSTVLIGGYGWLYLSGQRDGGVWSTVWFGVQSLGAMVLAVAVLRWAARSGVGARRAADAAASGGYRDDVSAMTKLHGGVCAHMLTARFDQILLARFAGPAPLGVYALAAAALEFAQAGAVVAAQRILGQREAGAKAPRASAITRSALPIALVSVAALAVLGLVRPQYHEAWILGLCLLPGCLAVCVGKIWSASLLKRRGERATTVVAFLTLAVAMPSYFIFIPLFGALGAALAASTVWVGYALATRASLRRAPLAAADGSG